MYKRAAKGVVTEDRARVEMVGVSRAFDAGGATANKESGVSVLLWGRGM